MLYQMASTMLSLLWSLMLILSLSTEYLVFPFVLLFVSIGLSVLLFNEVNIAKVLSLDSIIGWEEKYLHLCRLL